MARDLWVGWLRKQDLARLGRDPIEGPEQEYAVESVAGAHPSSEYLGQLYKPVGVPDSLIDGEGLRQKSRVTG